MKNVIAEIKFLIISIILLVIGVCSLVPLAMYLYKTVPPEAVVVYDKAFPQKKYSKEAILSKDSLSKKNRTTDSISEPTNMYDKTGPIGDTFGGIVGPFVALVAALLTFLAFYIQYRANELQRRDLKIERFENKYFELIKLHKENVKEINIIGRYNGRKSFVYMFNEFRLCFKICSAFNDGHIKDEKLDPPALTRLSYTVFFFGVGRIQKNKFT